MRRVVVAALAAFAVAVSWSVTPVSAKAVTAAKPYDFDGDGYPDLVVGAPWMRINDVWDAGAVVVLPASAAGLSLQEQLISQSSPGVPGASEEVDLFGSSVASADFDRDGYADLAVGAWNESVGRRGGAGSVTVVYGSAQGLDTSRSVWIGRPGGSAKGVQWGRSLVAGDFTADGYPDLAAGAPQESAVRVLPGSADGLRTTGVRLLGPQGSTSDLHNTEFGQLMAAGDLDRDGTTDLVVGAYGSVSYCAGQPGGPTACPRLAAGDDYIIPRDLAVGNMSGDARPEIAVGTPGGGVRVLSLTSSSPLTVARRTVITQNSAGVPGSDEADDAFGFSLAVGDLDKDGYADLVVGAKGENETRGRVTVVHGAATGWRTQGNCFYSQNTPGVPGVAEETDQFGWAVTLLDHDQDGFLDLTVGAAQENYSGAITTLRGSSGCGFTTKGSRTFGLGTLGYPHQSAFDNPKGGGGAMFGSVLGRP
jgi:hypothetical protein